MPNLEIVSASAPTPTSGPYEYRRGWLIHNGGLPESLRSWTSFPLGGKRSCSIHPATKLVRVSRGDIQVTLIGLPVDLENCTTDGINIAQRIAAKTENGDVLNLDAVKYISYLGGRFVCLLNSWSKDALSILTDCTATLPTYWTHAQSKGFAAASHATLCASTAGSAKDPAVAELIDAAKKMNTPGTLFPPGTMTGYTGVQQVLPNHLLYVGGQEVQHKRYYPFADTKLNYSEEDAFSRFSRAFSLHTKLLSDLGPIGVSLTGGLDSRATLTASLPHVDERTVTWTYFNSRNPHPEHLADLEGARALADLVGVRHLAVDLGAAPSKNFERAYQISMGATAQMRRVPLAYNAQLPGDLIELQSMAAEVGTGFYKTREGTADVPRLSQLYARGEFAALPQVSKAIEEFIEYAEFRTELFGAIDFHDLFYWEHRLGRWGSRRIQEVDLAHTIVLPFNSRDIIESLMSKPIAERHDKRDLVRFISEKAPMLAGNKP